MSLNPYESPHVQTESDVSLAPEPVSPESAVPYTYESQARTLWWLNRMFLISAVGSSILLIIDLLNLTTSWPDTYWVQVGQMMYRPCWIVYSAVTIVMLPIALAIIFVYGSWIRRANRNARALGVANMKFTPGWCFGFFFVPFANLIRPYQAVRELYQTSAPSAEATGWEKLPATLVGWWWAAWILANMASHGEARLLGDDLQSEHYDTLSSGAGVISSGLWIAACYLAAKVVISITQRQEEKRQASLQDISD